MGRISVPPMGPYGKWVSEYLDLSNNAFDLLARTTTPPLSPGTATHHTVYVLSMHAEATSIATRLALTYCLALPAFALTRVRIEQCIVASYLLHAPSSEGIDAYLRHHPVQIYEVLRKGARHFELDVNLESIHRTAIAAAAPTTDLPRTWTSLQVPQMAERRDAYSTNAVAPWKLSDEYWALYPLASLGVHGGAETNFWLGELHSPTLDSAERYPYFLPHRARALASAVARLDIIQCAEVLRLLSPQSSADVSALVTRCESEMQRDA